jgi:hypothetical protein
MRVFAFKTQLQRHFWQNHITCEHSFLRVRLSPYKRLQTMCQGHGETPNLLLNETTSSEQQSHPNQKRKQKFKSKQQYDSSSSREHTPPGTPAPPTHEIIKSGAVQLANGIPYVDV